MEVFVFKTSVETQKDIHKLDKKLDSYRCIKKWNFDLEDCDKILRIESIEVISNLVIETLRQSGYHCEELPD